MMKIYKIFPISLAIVCFGVSSLLAIDEKLAQAPAPSAPLQRDQIFVLHNMYGCGWLDKPQYDTGKEMKAKVSFRHVNGRSLNTVSSNFITLKAGERLTVDLAKIQLWHVNLWDEENPPAPTTVNDISFESLNIELRWPVGATFSQTPKQPFKVVEEQKYPWRAPKKEAYQAPEDYRGYATGGIDLSKGRCLKIIKDDVIINGDYMNPCAAILQYRDEDTFVDRF